MSETFFLNFNNSQNCSTITNTVRIDNDTIKYTDIKKLVEDGTINPTTWSLVTAVDASGHDSYDDGTKYKDQVISWLNELGHQPVTCMGGGAKKTMSPKRTSVKVKIGSVERCVYLGPKGGKYVKISNKFVPLANAQKRGK